MNKEQSKLKNIKSILLTILIIAFSWGAWTYFEMDRVRNNQKPYICFYEVKDTEDTDEYYKMCYGIFYKYKEYYSKKTNELTGREFTLFFKCFERDSDRS